MIDTHSHIYLEQFDADRDETIARARAAGLAKILLPNIDSTSVAPMLAVEAAYPDLCSAMIGLHPGSVKENYRQELQYIESCLEKRPFIAIGEIGMDLYWDTTFKKEQEEVLRIQLQWSAEKGLPVVLHTRSAYPEIFRLIDKYYDSRLSGVFHSFSGSLEDARLIEQMPNFYIGIGGPISYKNSTLPTILASIGYERLMLETDAPYLPPVPYRGKRNEPAYLVHTRDKLAALFDVSPGLITEVTTHNACKLFKLTQ